MHMHPVRLLFPALLLLSACAAPRGGADYTFDGFRLGQSYAPVMQRAPYDRPCDNDPIDQRQRRFMVYGAMPCRNLTFPEQTTVLFYLGFQQDTPYTAPIRAFGYLGGSYYATRSDFPFPLGTPLPEGGAAGFGKVLKLSSLGSFTLPARSGPLTVTRFEREIQLLDDGRTLVGVVVGPLPEDPENEQWRGLLQMWDRYTRPATR